MKYEGTAGRGPGNEIRGRHHNVECADGHYQVFCQGAYLGSVACPESVMLAVVNMLDRSFASGQRGVQNGIKSLLGLSE